MVHDMLHMRGGHQVNWFFDGIPVVNTNIAANVAPLINPKNVEELEIERGGFSSEYGDRTYGFFNVVTPSGFERDNEAELIASAGNFYSTDDQINIGGHTQRFAYYASVDGNRSELGLGTPVSQVIHDQSSGVGGFISLLYNPSCERPTALDCLAARGSLPDSQCPDEQAAGIRDLDLEHDYLAGFHWTHSFADGVLFSLAPYFHFNSAHYAGGPNDTPFVLDDNARSNYFGGRSVLQAQKKQHNARVGVEVWGQHDNTFFGLTANPGGSVSESAGNALGQFDRAVFGRSIQSNFVADARSGLRFTHYDGPGQRERRRSALGAAIRIPRLQLDAARLLRVLLPAAAARQPGRPCAQFRHRARLRLHSAAGRARYSARYRVEHSAGAAGPLDVDSFHTSARNFLDHDVIGDSGIFIPLTDLGAIIGGTEVTLRSPRLWRVAQCASRIPIRSGKESGRSPADCWSTPRRQLPARSRPAQHRHFGSVVEPALAHVGHAGLPVRFRVSENGDGPAHLPPH